ncbi:MAG: type II toxin-antitoxin system RelE/ParE family toxin [Erysipelotrichaceae bacterium]|nr:type II toxin-antitoxin system RelE/ParE family toxin [Erysipelotrichaceae bacterium]
MKYRVELTNDALLDINRAYDEIFQACLDNNTTKEYINSLLDKLEIISDFPESGTPLYFGRRQSEYRYVIYKSYIAFYHLHNGTIFIDRILYGKSDYIKTLKIN